MDREVWFVFQDFLEKCLEKDPERRPTARDLLFHSVLFEVHSLTLLAAHAIVNNGESAKLITLLSDVHMYKCQIQASHAKLDKLSAGKSHIL